MKLDHETVYARLLLTGDGVRIRKLGDNIVAVEATEFALRLLLERAGLVVPDQANYATRGVGLGQDYAGYPAFVVYRAKPDSHPHDRLIRYDVPAGGELVRGTVRGTDIFNRNVFPQGGNYV